MALTRERVFYIPLHVRCAFRYVELVQETRALDGDMQMLVYENYSKFITATDTIRTMKVNVEGMGSRMELLEQNIAATTTQSELVNYDSNLDRVAESAPHAVPPSGAPSTT